MSSTPPTSTTPASRRSSRSPPGSCLVLLAGLVGRRRRRQAGLSIAGLATLGDHGGAADLAVGRARRTWSPARCASTTSRWRSALIVLAAAAFVHPALAGARSATAAGPPGHGDFHALLLGSVLGMAMLAQAQNLILLRRARAALDPALRALRLGAAARGSLESGLKYLIIGSIGSATLLYGFAFIYGASGSTDFAAIAAAVGSSARRRPAAPDRDRARRHRARVQALARPLPPVDARRLPGRADPGDRVHGGGDQGGGLRVARPLLRRRARPRGRRLAAGARGAGGGLDRGRQRRRARPGLAEAAARLLGHRPGRLHARRGASSPPRPGVERARLLPRRLHADEPGGVRRDRDPRARDARYGDDIRALEGIGRDRPCSPGR